MNEEQKNIETCLPENILSEVANVPTDPQFRSLVEESFDPLQQHALPQAGYDAYKKVVWTHQPYTFTSSVKQMKSNLILLLRRLWRFPFGRGIRPQSDAGTTTSQSGDGSIRSLADMWQHYITRLQGNAEYGIPSRLDQLTDLPAAPALLADRKISGAIGAPDGISIAQLLCNSAAADKVTEIRDDNVYAITRPFPITLFPNVEEFSFADGTTVATSSAIISGFAKPTLTVYGLRTVTDDAGFALFDGSFTKLYSYIKKIDGTAVIVNQASIEEIYLPELESANCIITWKDSGWWNDVSPNFHKLYAPKLKKITRHYGTGINANPYKSCLIGAQCPNLTKLELPALEELEGVLMGGSCCPNLEELRMPNLKRVSGSFVHSFNKTSKTDLQLLEVGAMETNLNLDWWNPTDKGTTFLDNFREFIALRLTDNGRGLTLTLSQAVRDAIHAAESTYGIENIIVTQKGWTLSPAPTE